MEQFECRLSGKNLQLKGYEKGYDEKGNERPFVYICNDLWIQRPSFTEATKMAGDFADITGDSDEPDLAKVIEAISKMSKGLLYKIKINSFKTKTRHFELLKTLPEEAMCIEFIQRFQQVIMNPFA